jgi:hypothetical protein
MIDIPQIEKKSLLPVGGIPSVHLGPTCQAGRNEMATMLLRAVMRQVFHEEWPRTDEAHISLENVQEFREFIQASAAHQLAESRESICIGQELSIGSASIGHCAELIQSKGLSAKPGAFLREQQRPTMNDPRRQCDKSRNRKKEREKADGHHQVEDALPREKLRNRCLGVIDHVLHNWVNFRDARRAMKSGDLRRTKALLKGVVFWTTTTCTYFMRGPRVG